MQVTQTTHAGAAGRTVLAPCSPTVARLIHALQREAIKEATGQAIVPPGATVLNAPRYTNHEYDDSYSYRTISSSDALGNEIALQSPNEANQDPRYRMHRPGVWYGTETRIDTDGRPWRHSLGYHVMDDFGDLVKVPSSY